MSRASRIVRGLGWTVALAAVLYGADRLFLGERLAPGWIEVAGVDQAERIAGAVTVPRYLPSSAGWPPSRVFARRDTPAWWLGLGPGETSVVLWMGTGEAPLPAPVQPLAGCLEPTVTAACPPGWSALSTRRGGSTVFFLSTLDPSDLARVAQSLTPRAR